ncbi:MAG: uroporphyrinogen-III synthase [Acidimicrobiia bacterium]
MTDAGLPGGLPGVGVTTPPDRTARLAGELSAVGLRPVPLPCVRIEPAPESELATARAAAEAADLLVLTSARAVELVWPDGTFPNTPVAAVGRATAAAVEACGGRVYTVGDAGAAELAARIAARADGKTVAYPRADGADPAALAALQAAGRLLTQVVYRAVPIAPDPDPVDAVTFTSPSAVQGWVASRSLFDQDVAVIGATTAAALERHGRAPTVMPSRPWYRDLAVALAEHLGTVS